MIILYRKNGGEVLGASTDVTAYAGVDNTFFWYCYRSALSARV
jgi:hypothetical protein